MDQIKFFWAFISAFVLLISCLLTPSYASDVTLTWDTDIQVEGYKIYYKTGSSGPPYNGTDAAEGDSPVDVGWASEFTLRALSDDEDYYFVVTAYNSEGESGYSNEVTTARSVDVSDVGSDEVDGGGGCFISTIISKH